MCEIDAKAPKIATGDRAILPEGARTIPIFVMGKQYDVPETLTIMKAMEFAGFKFLRGAGCRGGICGACPTVYRKAGDYKLYYGLACQTVVEPDMYLAQIPFFPANRADTRVRLDAHRHTAFFGKFDGIADQIYQNLPQFGLIRPNIPGNIRSMFDKQ